MHRILVVDDSEVIRGLVGTYLSRFDAEITYANTGTEGWEKYQAAAPDLVVSDIEMPGCSGIELARKIRRSGRPPIPIILMSSAQGDEGRGSVSRGEADLFIQKPIVSSTLTDAVARLLGVVEIEGSARSSRQQIRVVIADDTEVGRQLLVRLLERDSRFYVVGTAKDGAEAVELTVREKPQLVLLDALMPVLGGIDATRRIMRQCPTRVVVVTGAVGIDGARAALEATKAGALDLLAKPSWDQVTGPAGEASLERLRELAEIPVIRRWLGAKTPAKARSMPPVGEGKVRVVAICASTGGPAVLAQILPAIRPVLEHVSVLIVQHVLAGFSAALASWLGESTGLPVQVATDGADPTRGTVLIAPDGHHLRVESRSRVRVVDEPPVGAHRPSGTVLFESVARAFGPEVLAVMLTGMGRDGVEGLRAVRSARGLILVQKPDTCAVPGMPEAAVHEGLADLQLSPEHLAEEIVERIGTRRRGQA